MNSRTHGMAAGGVSDRLKQRKPWVLVVVCGAGAVLVASCASPGGDRSKPLSEAAREQEQRRLARQNAEGIGDTQGSEEIGGPGSLSEWIKREEARDSGASTAPALHETIAEKPASPGIPRHVRDQTPAAPETVAANAGATVEEPGTTTQPGAGSTLGTPGPSAPAAPADSPAREMARILASEAAASSAPLPALIRLGAVETLEPGSAGAAVNAESRLPAREREFVQAWRELHAGVAKGLDASGDVGQMTRASGEFARKARAWEPMRISRAALCTKVDGFGVYNELLKYPDSYKFIAGRPQKIIVYTELDSFVPAPVSRDGVSGYSVEMTQDLTLYHSSKDKDLAAWQKTGEPVNDFSRNPRRDFFVVQIIELPGTLSVGSYTLKVVLNSKSGSGGTAEAVIPIDIVADASVMRR